MHRLVFLLIILNVNLFAFEDPKNFPDLNEKYFKLSITEPDQKVGYHVGDIIKRQINLIVNEPYSLIEESLPIVGYEKRYRGQLLGITLQEVKKTNQNNIHKLDLTYQIFTNNVVAKPAFITADYYRVINKNKPEEILKIRVPELTIAVSPIAIFGDIKVEEDMSDFRGPLLINKEKYKELIIESILMAIISIIFLFYVYTRFTILPGFKKIFLPVYKKYKKRSNIETDKLIIELHQGLNKISNSSIFEKNLNDLYKQNPSFKNIDTELKVFFKISNNMLFNKALKNDGEIFSWLLKFSFHCHLCEKKLPIKSADINLIKI